MSSSISTTDSKKHYLRSHAEPKPSLQRAITKSKFHQPEKSSKPLPLKFKTLAANTGEDHGRTKTKSFLKKRKAESDTEQKVEMVANPSKRPCRRKKLSCMLNDSAITEATVLKQFIPQTDEPVPKVLKKRKSEEPPTPPSLEDYDPTYFERFDIQVDVEYTATMHVDPSCTAELKKCWKKLDHDSKLENDASLDPTDRESQRYIACIKGSKENGIDPWTKRYEVQWISPEVGYGLFAKTSYKKDEVIGVYAGDLTSHVDDQEYAFEWPNTPYEKAKISIDGRERGNATRFMNHAPEKINKKSNPASNVSTVEFFYKGLPYIIFIARRPIQEGEQLCYDYGDGYWEKKGVDPTLFE